MVRSLSPFLPAALALAVVASSSADDPVVFVSSFASEGKGTVTAYRFEESTGRLVILETTEGLENPFFLAMTPDARFLYAVHAKTFGGDDEQAAAYKIEGRTGRLTLLNRTPTRGKVSCSLNVDSKGKTLLVAGYTSGDVASLPIAADGSLKEAASYHKHEGSSVNPDRQKEPHAHCIVVSPDDKYAYVADLGIDKVLCYRLDAAAGTLAVNDPAFGATPPGAGPRHLVFHPTKPKMYVVNELSTSVTVCEY
ncbi:MAG: lactonase family protein, partial [Planctomycetia bacterium]